MAQLWSVRRGFSPAHATSFAHAFIRDAARLSIPLYAELLTATTAVILHGQWRYALGADDWAVIAYLGRRSSMRVGVRAVWDFDDGQSMKEPALWHLTVPSAALLDE